MPSKIPQLENPHRFDVRYISANGGIRWEHDWVNVSTVCVGDYVGLEEISTTASGMSISLRPSSAVFWSATGALEDAYSRLLRCQLLFLCPPTFLVTYVPGRSVSGVPLGL